MAEDKPAVLRTNSGRVISKMTLKILQTMDQFGEPMTATEIKTLAGKGCGNRLQSLVDMQYLDKFKLRGEELEKAGGCMYKFLITQKGNRLLDKAVQAGLTPVPTPTQLPDLIPTQPSQSVQPSQSGQPGQMVVDPALVVEGLFDKIHRLTKHFDEWTQENHQLKEEIKRLIETNESLLEENRQLRQLAGKQQSKPIPVPDYVMSSIVCHGETD